MQNDLLAPLQHGPVGLRLIRARDARVLQRELLANRSWLQPWEATIPGGVAGFDMRVSIRRLLQQHREGVSHPFVMEYDGEIAGQLEELLPAIPLVVPVSALAVAPGIAGVPISPVMDEVFSTVSFTT